MKVYLDHSATSAVDPRVVDVMRPFFDKEYGNASSLHQLGQEAHQALEEARGKVAQVLHCDPGEVVFTSGGTESNNTALKGAAFAQLAKGGEKKHLIASTIEHDCVLNTCKWLEKIGFEVTYVPVDKYGLVTPEALEDAIRKDTLLVSVMHANNEIGTVQDIKELGKIAHEHGAYFHTDAVQSITKLPLDVKEMNVDMLSVSSHKIHGPKGVGCLYVKKGTKIDPLMHGGGHERGFRSGTENVSGIVGFGEAAKIGEEERPTVMPHITKLRDKLIEGTLEIENSWLNGHPEKRLPINAHFCFRFIEGESLILRLDMKGISASTGSACSSKSLEPSHVLLAIGLPPEDAHSSLRLTLGRDNTEEDIDYTLEVLPEVVADLRKISPFKDSYE
ncbi:MAG: cysteine desulfurase NifS [Theionarchaea archaeon DG-70-1]|nr:MAG: cysteine desulfurase NifS [Theionarchaea archaeon DG-70-1]